MANNIGTFDFRKLSLIFGTFHITGFAEGDAIEISEENDAFSSVGGADGGIDRIKNNANFLNVICRLRQTSPTNQVLSGIHNSDRATSLVLPLLLVDSSGATLIGAKAAWIVRNPTISFGTEAKQREWMIKTGSDYVVNLAGNE